MPSQHAMHQPITGLIDDIIQNAMQLTVPIQEPAEAQKDQDGRRVESTLVP